MNLERFASLRGEAWARRELRRAAAGTLAGAKSVWPGKMREARKLAGKLGRPRLLEALAEIIQKRASAAWGGGSTPEENR
jgi:hypothetical protein